MKSFLLRFGILRDSAFPVRAVPDLIGLVFLEVRTVECALRELRESSGIVDLHQPNDKTPRNLQSPETNATEPFGNGEVRSTGETAEPLHHQVLENDSDDGHSVEHLVGHQAVEDIRIRRDLSHVDFIEDLHPNERVEHHRVVMHALVFQVPNVSSGVNDHK